MPSLRSLLFVPGNRADRFERAQTAGADAMCLDLEDSVAPLLKGEALEKVACFLSRARMRQPPIGLRINPIASPWWRNDLEAARAADFVVVPKSVSIKELGLFDQACEGRLKVWAQIESPEGLAQAWSIAAHPSVEGLIFGAFDFCVEMGCEMAWEPLLFARSSLAAACAGAHKQLLDAPYGDVKDQQGLLEFTRRAKALGFTGRTCIHPDQVAPVNEAFTPSATEIAAARRILEAFEQAEGAAAQLDGQLIELPVAKAARRVIERAQQQAGQ